MSHFLSIRDLDRSDIPRLFALIADLKAKQKARDRVTPLVRCSEFSHRCSGSVEAGSIPVASRTGLPPLLRRSLIAHSVTSHPR